MNNIFLWIFQVKIGGLKHSVLKTVRTRVEEEMELEDKEDVENRDPAVPTFAHIGPTVI